MSHQLRCNRCGQWNSHLDTFSRGCILCTLKFVPSVAEKELLLQEIADLRDQNRQLFELVEQYAAWARREVAMQEASESGGLIPDETEESEKPTDMKELMPTLGIVGPCRFSYMHVFRPRKNELSNEEEYSVVLLIPKEPNEKCPDPKENIDGVAKMIKQAAAFKFGEAEKKYDRPMKDGDAEGPNGEDPKHPGYWYLRAKAGVDYPPVLIGGDREKVVGGWESGDWGKAKVNFYAYDFKGRKGVSCGLRAIQFLYHDERFGAVTDPVSVANEFDTVANADKAQVAPEQDPNFDPFAETD